MEFLYKIYSNPNFALVLFGVIAVLLVLFVVVLILAIKDTKKRNIDKLDSMEKEELEKVNVEEQTNENAFAFNLDENSESLEFFANEDEISQTRDITFDTPVTENSMNNLLDAFNDVEEEKEEPKVEKQPTIDELIAKVNKDDETVNEIPNVFEGPDDDFFDLTQIDTIKPINEAETTEIDFASLQERLASSSVESKKDNEDTISNYLDESNEDDFELPAIKKEEVVDQEETDLDSLFATDDAEEVKLEDIKNTEIDLEKTGVLNFANIESESYEIK